MISRLRFSIGEELSMESIDARLFGFNVRFDPNGIVLIDGNSYCDCYYCINGENDWIDEREDNDYRVVYIYYKED